MAFGGWLYEFFFCCTNCTEMCFFVNKLSSCCDELLMLFINVSTYIKGNYMRRKLLNNAVPIMKITFFFEIHFLEGRCYPYLHLI